MLKRSKTGQGMLEYILVLVVILLAILAGTQGIKKAMDDQIFTNAKGQIEKAGGQWKNVQ